MRGGFRSWLFHNSIRLIFGIVDQKRVIYHSPPLMTSRLRRLSLKSLSEGGEPVGSKRVEVESHTFDFVIKVECVALTPKKPFSTYDTIIRNASDKPIALYFLSHALINDGTPFV